MGFVQIKEFEERLAENFDRDEASVLAVTETMVRESAEGEGHGRALRDAHAKAYGLVRGRMTILDGLEPAYAQGIYRTPSVHDVLIRYSNGLGHLRPDRGLGVACGMAIKIFDVPGESLLDDEPDAGTFDYTLINNPTFFCNTARDYLVIQPLFAELPDALADPVRRRSWLYEFLTRGGEAPPQQWLWDELFSLLSFAAVPRKNLLMHTYWSMGAFRHGDWIAKVRAVPTAASAGSITRRKVDVLAEAEPFRRTLVEEVGERDHTFDLQVQLCADLSSMPVDNTSVPWPETRSPFRTVARIDIPAQDISAPRNLEQADAVSYNPWRTRSEHAPLGEIMRLRREVYRRSATVRRQMNHQPHREPASIDEALR